jgi:glutathione S-transferase
LNAEPILYSFRRCPYAMRARMALQVSGTACETREVKLSDKPAELVELSPKATVPVLVTSEGLVIDQSIDIMRWALGRHDPENWLASANDPLIAANDGRFKFHLDRYKYPDRHQSDAIKHRGAATQMLDALESRLSICTNLARPTRSMVDLAIMPFVRQFANTDRTYFDALPLPETRRWLADHIGSPLFKTIMIARPVHLSKSGKLSPTSATASL